MKKALPKRLFWFVKNNSSIDLEHQNMLDEYIQQVLSRGRFEDVKELLHIIERRTFINSFKRIKHFLPIEIRRFWEDGIKSIDCSTGEDY